MDTIDEEVNKAILSCGNITKYGCMNIIVSVKLNELKKKGIISEFRIVNECTVSYTVEV